MLASTSTFVSELHAVQDVEVVQFLEAVEAEDQTQEKKSEAYLDLGFRYLYGNSTVGRNVSRAMVFLNEVGSRWVGQRKG